MHTRLKRWLCNVTRAQRLKSPGAQRQQCWLVAAAMVVLVSVALVAVAAAAAVVIVVASVASAVSDLAQAAK